MATAPLSNNRIIKQDSLFIFTSSGKIEDSDFKARFIIYKDSKPAIRGELERLCGITQTNIYPDFYGFATSNSADKNYQESTVEELTEQADKYYQQGKYIQAEPYYADALKTAEKQNDTTVIADCQNNLGFVLDSLGKYEEAIEYLQLALASDLKTYGEAHLDVARDRNNLGLVWKSLGKTKKAIEYFEMVLATCKQTLGDEHPNTKMVAENLADAKKANGE